MTGRLADPAVTAVSAAAHTIPTDLPEADGTLAWSSTTWVVVTVQAGGRTGLGWTYGPPACAHLVNETLASVVEGRAALDVAGTHAELRAAVRNIGWPGVASYAVSAVDVALWDLKARLLDVPLHRLLGEVRERVPVYASGGFTTYDEPQLDRQLEEWVAAGHPRMKIKIGEDWGSRVGRDLARVDQVRSTVGPEVAVYVDANGGYAAKQAVRVGRRLDERNVTWFEEPVSSDDKPGLAQVRAAVDCDVTAGEYATDGYEFARLCPVVDCLQVDATRCGGITGWLDACALARTRGLEVSGHCAPYLHAAVAAATPNLRHLEYFHDHVRIERRFLDGTSPTADGELSLPDGPGHGLSVRTSDLAGYAG
ncbi:MAG: enolase C-terminal domain-like protein [Marmoricola sp.]